MRNLLTVEPPRGLLHYATRLLVAASWLSGAIFGAYILIFFGGTALGDGAERWNASLPGLHNPAEPLATLAIAAHFVAGGILLIIGPLQLIGSVRKFSPALHRWLGRFYVASAGIAGLGGLGFIALNGTIGGPTMSLGFSFYGALMVVCAERTYTHARGRRIDHHRAWAIRLFALTVASWLYRMEYGFWFLTMGRTGHTSSFDGWFDIVMAFFFYLPNLLVAEAFIRARPGKGTATAEASLGVVLFAAAIFVISATCIFVADYWGPGIREGIEAI